MIKYVKGNNYFNGSVNIPTSVLLKLLADAGIDTATTFNENEDGSVTYQNKNGETVCVPVNNSGDALQLVIPNTPHGELVAYSYYVGEYNSLATALLDSERSESTLVIVEDVEPDVESPASSQLCAYVYSEEGSDEFTHKIFFTGHNLA